MAIALGYDGSRYDDRVPMLLRYYEGGQAIRLYHRVVGRWLTVEEWQRYVADTGYAPGPNEVGDVAAVYPDGSYDLTAAQQAALAPQGGPGAAPLPAAGAGGAVASPAALAHALATDPAAVAALAAALPANGGGAAAPVQAHKVTLPAGGTVIGQANAQSITVAAGQLVILTHDGFAYILSVPAPGTYGQGGATITGQMVSRIGGTGDFLRDGSVPLTGPVDAGGQAFKNVGRISGRSAAAPLVIDTATADGGSA